MNHQPFGLRIPQHEDYAGEFDVHTKRSLSALDGQFSDQRAFEAMLARDDVVLYEVFENTRPKVSGELIHGLSVVYPGRVGIEYFMTKGHFHSVLDTGEIYYCLRGEGVLVMETPEGDWAVEELSPNRVVYVPPRWAHRSVNTSRDEDLVTFFVYPGHAGHDYGTIEKQGFRKLVVDSNGRPTIVDNPRWVSPEGTSND
jgi:glucose-6-phosphate isomerase